MSDLARGASVQARVIYAVALRESRTRFGQHQLGYVWALLEPAFFIGTFAFMFYAVDRTTPMGMDVIPFLATGVLPYDLVVKTSDRVSLSVEANRALLFYPHVQPLDLAIARALLELATYAIVFVVIVGGYGIVTQSFAVDDMLWVVYGTLLSAMLGLALGIVLCSLTVLNNAVQRVKSPLMRPLFWISGLFFAANMIPLDYRRYLLWNPILHCVEMVRDGWFAQYDSQDASPEYVMMWIVLLAFAGLTLERHVRPKVQLS